jgi:tellurite resistance protein TehA-like permease
MNPSTIVFRVALVLIALAATSFFSSVGLELTNAPDDVSVDAGFALLGAIVLAWLYLGLRVLQKLTEGKGKDS